MDLFKLVFSEYMPRSRISGSYSSSLFKGTSILFSRVTVPIYIPTNSLGGFPLSTLSPVFIVCGFFDESHSGWYEVTSHCSFDLHFSNRGVEHIFMGVLTICMSSLENIYLFT